MKKKLQAKLKRLSLRLISLSLLIGCGGVKPIPYLPIEAPRSDKDVQVIREGWEQLLRAKSAGAFLKVDSKLGQSCARCSSRLELDAERAKLLSDPIKMVARLIGAMSDPKNPHPSYTLWSLKENQVWLHHKHSTELLGILLGMAESHPHPDTRRVAAHGAAELAHRLGDDGARARALSMLGEPLALKIIGPYSNQYGRGFWTPYPPELSWSESHKGEGNLSWQSQMTQDGLGYYNLTEGLYDQARHVGYAAQAMDFKEPQALSLRINARSPIKVWWNDQLIFEAERFNSQLFDIVSLPIQATQGVNKLLVKVAERSESALRVDLLSASGEALSADAYQVASLEAPLGEGAKATQLELMKPSRLIQRALKLERGLEDLAEGKGEGARPSLEVLYRWAKVAQAAGFEHEEARALELLLDQESGSLIARFEYVQSIFKSGEEGLANQMIEELDKQSGAQLPLIALTRAELAREVGKLGAYQAAVNKVRWRFRENIPIISAWLFGLAQRGEFGRMRRTIEYLKKVNPDAPFSLQNQIAYSLGLKKVDEALSAAYRLRDLYPGDLQTWHSIAKLEESRNGLAAQIKLWRSFIEREPHLRVGYLKLAQAYTTANELGALEEHLERWAEAHPSDPTRFSIKAELLDRQMVNSDTLTWSDIKPQLAAAWRSAFETYQGKRLYLNQWSYYEQEGDLFWKLRFPTDPELKTLVKSLPKTKSFKKKADVELVKDLSIYKIYRSGPSVLRRLKLYRALTETGIKRLQSLRVFDESPERSYSTVKRAYLLQPNGKKLNPTSIRNGVARFAQVKVGSVVVVEVESQRLAQTYFSNAFIYDWRFQRGRQRLTNAEVEVWVEEEGPALHVKTQGPVRELVKAELLRIDESAMKRFKAQVEKKKKSFALSQKRSDASPSKLKEQKEEFERGMTEEERSLKKLTEGWSRRRWQLQDRGPLMFEPFAKHVSGRSDMLSISTVSSWADVGRWERALLYNKLRITPKLKSKLKSLQKTAKGEMALLMKILNFVRRNIQYEIDYESSIAGHRPHSASLVLSRGYGDCKDQTALIVTLAREAGLRAEIGVMNSKVHELKSETPSPFRFDHMIAYVPAQGDIERPLFLDGTASYSDLEGTPLMLQGADVLLLYTEPELVKGELKEVEWVKVPWEPVERNQYRLSYELELNKMMELKGTVKLKGTGLFSSWLRQLKSSKDLVNTLKRASVKMALAPKVTAARGASRTLTQPAEISAKINLGQIAAPKSKVLTIRAPQSYPNLHLFNNSKRTLPLEGIPLEDIVISLQVRLPQGAQVASVPQTLRFKHKCIELSMIPSKLEGGFEVRLESRMLCSEISLDEYREISQPLVQFYQNVSREGFTIKL